MALPGQVEQSSPRAVKFKTLASFNGVDGRLGFGVPNDGLVQGLDGNLYGTTAVGGVNSNSNIYSNLNCGTVFRITPSGALSTVYSFCAEANCVDGAVIYGAGALALDTEGNLYGTTYDGGASATSGPCAPIGCGTIFKVTPGGALTTLHNFCSQPNCADGDVNYSGVVRGADGNFYGVTPGNGANSNTLCIGGFTGVGCGTVFKITPEGVFSTIYSFCSQTNCADGADPFTGLLAGVDGSLYGIATTGGANGAGTIFKLTLSGKLTTLYSFPSGGLFPCDYICAPLIQGGEGNIYGATTFGGSNGGPLGPGAGTFFQITPTGTFTTLYNFCAQTSCTDGAYPFAVVQGTDRNFYGVAEAGGTNLGCSGPGGTCGSVFKITPQGTPTTLYDFVPLSTGGQTPTGIVQATNGVFYGVTIAGGANNFGSVFAMSVGLGPFIETLPTSGKTGLQVKILGNNLISATGVTFNGVAAPFTVESATLISATVPTGATTGKVEVVTPTRTLKSNVKFVVRP
jgi:uncharacterized repeat protein (TIGR03803 family)